MKSKIAEEIRDNTTPLEELLFWLESFEDMPIKPTYTNMKEKIWQLLPKEKHIALVAENEIRLLKCQIEVARNK